MRWPSASVWCCAFRYRKNTVDSLTNKSQKAAVETHSSLLAFTFIERGSQFQGLSLNVLEVCSNLHFALIVASKIRQLHETMEAAVQTAADAEKWIALMKQYVNPVELTAELLNTLIEKITVHEAVKGEDGSREQEVEIYYRFIGKID